MGESPAPLFLPGSRPFWEVSQVLRKLDLKRQERQPVGMMTAMPLERRKLKLFNQMQLRDDTVHKDACNAFTR